MHRLTASILYVSNTFQNRNVPIYEILNVSPPPFIQIGLKDLTPMFLSINIMIHFVFGARMKFKEQTSWTTMEYTY